MGLPKSWYRKKRFFPGHGEVFIKPFADDVSHDCPAVSPVHRPAMGLCDFHPG